MTSARHPGPRPSCASRPSARGKVEFDWQARTDHAPKARTGGEHVGAVGGRHYPRHWLAGDQDTGSCPDRRGSWFRGDFCAEVNNDSVGTAQLMGLATRHIKVGTWVADIYLRVPYLCAKAAIITADATGGRFILRLGVSHQPVNRGLGIDMPDPMGALRKYTTRSGPTRCAAKDRRLTGRSSTLLTRCRSISRR
jgi:alkanesulfonate monooxygenase SsuD/methylene tetrahydromethanopterin reductase-like flavin-dependent oxidoreductase (luciferase family)